MYSYKPWSKALLLTFIAAISLTVFACNDGTVNGPQTREPYQEPEPDPLSLSVSGTCGQSNAFIAGTVANATDSTQYAIKDSSGTVIAEGVVEDDSIPKTSIGANGSYSVSAQDGNRQAETSLSIECFQKPTGPGNFRRISEECYIPNDWQRQGKFTVQATRGWDRIKLVNIDTGETLIDEDGIDPVEDQTRTFDGGGNGLDDARYEATAYRNGEPAVAEYVAACDRGPGDITVNKQCNTDTGVADFSLTIERGIQSFDITRDGNAVDSGSGITPEPNQTLPLGGGQYEDVPNGDYSGNFTRSGISTSKEWSINCQEDLTPPNAKFDFTTDDLTVDFDASESNDPDGEIVSYSWEFGDGSTGSGVTPSHTYDEPGTYTVTLTVEDNDGLTGDFQKDVTVEEPQPPTAAFTFTTDELTADFDGSDSFDPDGEIVSYQWQFGDGTTGSGVMPSHTYDEPGTYPVTLTVEDDDGLTGETQKDVVVDAEPKICGCVYTFDDEDHLTDSKGKFFRKPLFSDEIVPVEPYSDWVNFRVDARYGGKFAGDPQPNEGFGLSLSVGQDSTYTDVAEDPYDGIEEAWIYQDITVDASNVPVDQQVAVTAVHQNDPAYGLPGNNGFNSVWFKDVSGNNGNTAKTQASTKHSKQISQESNAPAVAYNARGEKVSPLSKSTNEDRGDYVRVTFEVAPGQDCPPRYDPVN